MRILLRLVTIGLALALGVDWVSPESGRPPWGELLGDRSPAPLDDADVAQLASITEAARQRAQTATPAIRLHQISLQPAKASYWFGFTDAAATREIAVSLDRADPAHERWQVSVPPLSKRVGSPNRGLDLWLLRVGPAQIARELATQQPACTGEVVRLTLGLNDQTSDVEWVVFCEFPAGLLSGVAQNRPNSLRLSSELSRRLAVATPSGR